MAFSTIIIDYLGEGVAAARPATLAGVISPTALGLYLATDTGALSAWDGSAWVAIGANGLVAIADGDVLANISGGSAVPIGNTLSAVLDAVLGTTQGDVIYRGAAGWAALGPGTSGNVLTTGGAGADPAWAVAPGGAGTVTSVTAGTGLSGGVITSTGTVALDAITGPAVLAVASGSAVPAALSPSAVLDTIGATQGDLLYRNASGWVVLASGSATNVLVSNGAAANPAWKAGAYTLAGFFGPVLTGSQVLLFHQFPRAVTFPSNFGATSSGGSSVSSSLVAATASTAITISRCLAANDPTNGANFSAVGTLTVTGHTGAFSTTGSVAFAASDYIKIVGPASPDATLANLTISIVGDQK